MKQILNKLFTGDSQQLCENIISKYEESGFTIVNIIYFAAIVSQKLFQNDQKTINQKNYKKILLKSDFLLPDGIALQIFYFFARILNRIKSNTFRLNNLNGTDFIPYFLDNIKTKYGNQKICLLLYGTYPEYIEKAKEYIAYKGYNVVYIQDGYSEFNREKAKESLSDYMHTINILLIGRSSTKLPIQELWTGSNMREIRENKLLVINTGGLFDFWAGVQKRAPKFIRTIKLERLRRFITDPKRNLKKVYNSLSCFNYIFKYLLLKKD